MAPQVIKTLLYSDIFNYPLKIDEIHKYLITSEKIDKNHVEKALVNERVKQKFGYFHLNNRSEIVELRLERERESNKKIKYAREKTKLLKLVPGIIFLGISGSLSMRNAGKDDDIDLFIICGKNQIWSTRLLSILILKTLGIYRERDEENPSNKFCLNMIIDESSLLFSKTRQDIYSAHEIVQVLPIFDRKNSYINFLKVNIWIKKYLANFQPEILMEEKTNFIINFFWKIIQIFGFEKVSKYVQLKYMKRKNGRETIASGFLAFHPNDPRKNLVGEYNSRLKNYKNHY